MAEITEGATVLVDDPDERNPSKRRAVVTAVYRSVGWPAMASLRLADGSWSWDYLSRLTVISDPAETPNATTGEG